MAVEPYLAFSALGGPWLPTWVTKSRTSSWEKALKKGKTLVDTLKWKSTYERQYCQQCTCLVSANRVDANHVRADRIAGRLVNH